MRPSSFLLGALLATTASAAGSGSADRVAKARYPEGPLWHGEQLYFAEMRSDRITLVEGRRKRTFFSQRDCGPTALAPYGGGFLVLCHLGARVVAVDAEGREVRRWEQDDLGIELTDPNDASADGKGGVYFSDPGRFALTGQPEGRVMHLSADGALRSVADPLLYPNGVHVRGSFLYVSEHLARRILRYNILPDGRLGAKQVFADLSGLARPARWKTEYLLWGPDGLEFGTDGNLYVAIYGEGQLAKLSPQGELLGLVEMQTRYLTNIAFGTSSVAVTGSFDNRATRSKGEVRIQSRLPQVTGG